MYKVMIVDDEPLFRDYMRSKLDWASHGFHICCEAANGREALEEAKENRPDLAFIDISMPFIDGLELTELLKQTQPDISVVFVTGHSEFDYARQAVRLGAQDYLLKPFNKVEFSTTLQRVKRTLDERSRPSFQEKIPLQKAANLGVLPFDVQETLILTLRMREMDAVHEELSRIWQVIHKMDISISSARGQSYLEAFINLCRAYILESELNPEEVWGTESTLEQQRQALPSWEEALGWIAELFSKAVNYRQSFKPSKSYQLFTAAKAYIQQNYSDSELTVEGVAQALYVDASYLRKVFRKEASISVVDYITYIRMKEAKDILLTRPMKLSAVAEKVGYNDPNYFSKCFKKRFGLTPSEFEQLHANKANPE
ncbi:response regulator [Paenibacillus woosongensis]|uniref:Response regulator n=1 Tax=Paenibacillus woosongensis TaxID=307580 RepID=A0AA95I782_9BACL|nr:response regulator [Paenibacillus woosongensis]WHX47897.1 response regulator [Paenibacillus woosongensis]